MKFNELRHRVGRAEELVEGRRQQTLEHTSALFKHWRQGWTPWRIVAVGLGLGFLTGQTRPSRTVGAAKWLKMAGSMSSVFTSLQAAMAAWQADQAVDKADDAAESAQAAAEATHQAAATVHKAADRTVEDEATQAAQHAARTRAAGVATADDGAHVSPRRVSSYAPSLEVAPGETEHWASHPPRPAEAATDVSER